MAEILFQTQLKVAGDLEKCVGEISTVLEKFGWIANVKNDRTTAHFSFTHTGDASVIASAITPLIKEIKGVTDVESVFSTHFVGA